MHINRNGLFDRESGNKKMRRVIISVQLCSLPIALSLLVSCSKLDAYDISANDLKIAREAVKLNADGVQPNELKGIDEVSVAIDRTCDFAKVKIADAELLNPMTLKLRMAGLKVRSFQEALQNSTWDRPLLQQNIRTSNSECGDTVFNVETKLFDYAIRTRDMTHRQLVAVWESSIPDLDGVRRSQVKAAIIKASQQQTDEFLTNYLKQKGL